MSYYGPAIGGRGENQRRGSGHGWPNYDQRIDFRNRDRSSHRPSKKSRKESDLDRKGDDVRDRGGFCGRDQNGRSSQDLYSKANDIEVAEETMTQQELSNLRQERNREYPHKDITKKDFLNLSKEHQIMAIVSAGYIL